MNPAARLSMVSAGPTVSGEFEQQENAAYHQDDSAGDKRRMVAPIDHQHAQPEAGCLGEGERGQPLPALLQFEADENPGANPEHHQQESVEEKEKIEIGFESGSHASATRKAGASGTSRMRAMQYMPISAQTPCHRTISSKA
jgi:hypothetical protein